MPHEKIDFLTIDLKNSYNLDGIATAEDPVKGKLDGHYAMRAEELPKPGRVQLLGVPFEFPVTREKGPNCLIPEGQRIAIPPRPYRALYFLGNSVLGSSDAEIGLAFQGKGQTEQAPEILRFTDWCHNPQFNELEAVGADYRYHAAGLAAPANSIWLQVILLPPGKRLESISLGNSPNMRIFGMTLGLGAYEASPSFLLLYLLDRLGLQSEEALAFGAKYRSLVDLAGLFPDRNIADDLLEIQKAFIETLSLRDLHAYNKERVRGCFQKLLPRLEGIRQKAAARAAASREGRTTLEFTLVGHSHLDAVWLWPWDETVEKAFRTFSRNLKRLDLFPKAVYNQSSPQFYQWMERYYPEVFEGIRKKVASGQWELVGGMWIEPDGNMPCGEALVRQRLYGQRYFLSRFGRLSEVAWIPDTFGMHANHPQIIRKTGGKYFFTTKLAWNYENVFPYQHFIWESPDGSRVLALQDAVGCGASPGPHGGIEEKVRERNVLLVPGKQVRVNVHAPHVPNDCKSEEIIPEVLVIYGAGDGGEGPSDKMFHRAETLTSLPEYRHGTVHEHFHTVEEKYGDRLPVWNDELYLENHRGTLSSQGRIKTLNRKGEAALLAAEKWACLSQALDGFTPAKATLDRIWKKLLFNQFHDILPGTSIPQAYVDAEPEFEDIFRTAENLQENALRSLLTRFRKGEDRSVPEKRGKRFETGRPLYLFNPLSWERNETVQIPFGFTWVRVLNESGEEIPSQVLFRDGRHWLVFQAKVPAFGYATVRLMAREKPSETAGLSIHGLTAENRFCRMDLDEGGDIRQTFDKELQRNLLKGPANHIHFYRNHPKEWSNWNIDPGYEKHEIPTPGKARIEILNDGPVVAAFRITRPAPSGGKTVQEIRLYRDEKRIDFINDIEVKYNESLVKAAFHFDVGADFVTAEIGYGTCKRPTRPANSFEKARWEVWTQKWLDLSGPCGGVTLVNRDRYGFDVRGDRIRLTLVKGGIEPDPNTDAFTHRIEYALTSHEGGMEESHAWRKGYEYNFPITPCFEEDPELSVPAAMSFGSVSADHVCWEAFKPEEEGDGFVIRLYEVEGRDVDSMTLTLPFNIARAEEIDFLELEVQKELKCSDNRVYFPIGHNEIKAIRVYRA